MPLIEIVHTKMYYLRVTIRIWAYGLTLLALGSLIILYLFFSKNELVTNLLTEACGVAFTIFIIDVLFFYSRKKNYDFLNKRIYSYITLRIDNLAHKLLLHLKLIEKVSKKDEFFFLFSGQTEKLRDSHISDSLRETYVEMINKRDARSLHDLINVSQIIRDAHKDIATEATNIKPHLKPEIRKQLDDISLFNGLLSVMLQNCQKHIQAEDSVWEKESKLAITSVEINIPKIIGSLINIWVKAKENDLALHPDR